MSRCRPVSAGRCGHGSTLTVEPQFKSSGSRGRRAADHRRGRAAGRRGDLDRAVLRAAGPAHRRRPPVGATPLPGRDAAPARVHRHAPGRRALPRRHRRCARRGRRRRVEGDRPAAPHRLDAEIARLQRARAYLEGALLCRYDHPATDCRIMGEEIETPPRPPAPAAKSPPRTHPPDPPPPPVRLAAAGHRGAG